MDMNHQFILNNDLLQGLCKFSFRRESDIRYVCYKLVGSAVGVAVVIDNVMEHNMHNITFIFVCRKMIPCTKTERC